MKKYFDKIFSIFSRRKSVRGYSIGANPATDWSIVFFSFIICVIAIVFFTVLHYERTQQALTENLEATASTTPAVPDQNLIDRVVKKYDGKKAEFNVLLTNPTAPADPSK